MRICFLASSHSAHIQKWSSYFISQGHEVHLVSFDSDTVEGAQHHPIGVCVDPKGSDASKLKYLTSWKKTKRIIDSIGPDLISVHYASSYGSLAALACQGDYVLSVWGSDIYEFPLKSPLHRILIKYALSKAGLLLSTSKAMAEEASKYTDRPFEITPFGVDAEMFKPSNHKNKRYTIAIVKTLSPKYGIDVLLEAAALVRQMRPDIDFVIRIAGDGLHANELHALSDNLGLAQCVEWLGYISQEEAAQVWSEADVAVVPSSAMESFGVSAVEAQACGVPVIISDVPGLMESTVPGRSSLTFPRGNSEELAKRIVELFDDPDLAQRLGQYGRENVIRNYLFDRCFSHIERLFMQYIDRYQRNSASSYDKMKPS